MSVAGILVRASTGLFDQYSHYTDPAAGTCLRWESLL
jgi:hypothetical protein